MRDRLAALLPRLKAAVDRRPALEPSARARLDDALAVAYHDYDIGHSQSEDGDDPIAALAAVFSLDELDQELLVIAAAPELDATMSIIFGELRGGAAASRASVGLALELCGVATLDATGVERLGNSASLRHHGLVEVGTGPWLGRELSVPDRVTAHLLGVNQVDPAVRAIAMNPVPLELAGAELLARAIENGATLAWVRAKPGTAGLSLAAAAFAMAGLRCLCIDLDRAPAAAALTDLVRSAAREAALLGACLVVGGADRLAVDSGTSLSVLDDAAVPVIAVGARAWDRTWLARYPIAVDAPALTPADREAAWAASGADDTTKEGLAGLRLTPEAIAQTAFYARRLAEARGEKLSPEIVRQAARRVGGSDAPVRNTGRGNGFADLVLPEHLDASLRRLVGWARHRDEALSRGTLLDLGRKGAGLAALFTGGPGTGKTLAAHVVADELGIDLVQVDLTTIVDKYIGETEKNLEKVFQQAESLNVVLFFDEADALFGRRSEVKDSHDRHANQEVAYLLQRMENFDGLTILATNLRGNLDPAFSRRMNFIIHFPDPDVATRLRLWQAHLDRLGPLDPRDRPDLDRLAESVELSGGDIRNIVLGAGYDAAAAGERPGMRHIVSATIGEYQKLGRRVPATGFGGPSAIDPPR